MNMEITEVEKKQLHILTYEEFDALDELVRFYGVGHEMWNQINERFGMNVNPARVASDMKEELYANYLARKKGATK